MFKTTIKNTDGQIVGENEYATKTKAEFAGKHAALENKAIVEISDLSDIEDDGGTYLIFKYETDGTVGGYHHTGELIGTVTM